MEQRFQVEADSLGGDPLLRRLKDDEVLRPADAKACTVKALQERCLIRPGKVAIRSPSRFLCWANKLDESESCADVTDCRDKSRSWRSVSMLTSATKWLLATT
jgi:hypothetical protein